MEKSLLYETQDVYYMKLKRKALFLVYILNKEVDEMEIMSVIKVSLGHKKKLIGEIYVMV